MDDVNRTSTHMSTKTIHIDLPNGTLSKVPIVLEVPKDLSPDDESSINLSYSPSDLEPSLFDGINLDDFVDVVTTYKCKFCTFSCAWKSGLMSHLRTTHIEGLCRNDEEIDDISEDDSRKIRETSSELQPVGSINEKVSVQRIFLCGQCNRGFASLNECKEHVMKDHKTRKRKKTKQKKQVKSEEDKRNERKTDKRQATDYIETLSKRKVRPPKSLSEDYQLSKTRCHVKKHESKEKLYKCEVKSCNQQFSFEETLKYHGKCHIDANLSDCSFTFQCPECSSRMNNWRLMTNHLWTVHQVDMELFSCPDCSYRTTSRYKLETHRPIHRDERDFICAKCNKGFKQLNQLRNHQVVHTDRKNVKEPCWFSEKKCEQCNRSFSDSKCLRKHVEAVHNKPRPYVCSFCGHTAARKAMLQLHVRQHTGEKPFRCDTCDYATGDHNSLRRHKMRHTGLKKYKCPHCSYACIQSSSFKTHIKTKHPKTDDGLYCCELCAFRSVNKDNYDTHLVDHKRDVNVVTKVTEPTNTIVSEGVERPQEQSLNRELDAMDIIPENLAAAQLIFSCLNAFSEKAVHNCSFEAIDNAKSQTITIHIPNDEIQRDGDQIYLTFQQPDVINVLNDNNVNKTAESEIQTGFELTVCNEETRERRNTNEMCNSDISLVTSSGDRNILDFCAVSSVDMPMLMTDTSS